MIDLIFKVNKRSTGSDVRRKAISQIFHCSRKYVLKKLERCLGRTPQSVLKGLNRPFRTPESDHSVLNINFNFRFFLLI